MSTSIPPMCHVFRYSPLDTDTDLVSLSPAVFEIFGFDRMGVTTMTFQGHVTSSFTWPFDSQVVISYRCSNGTKLEPLAVAVSPYGWLMTHYGWLAAYGGLSKGYTINEAYLYSVYTFIHLIPPYGFLNFFPKWLGIFNHFYTPITRSILH